MPPGLTPASIAGQRLEGAAELSLQEPSQAWTDVSLPEKSVCVGGAQRLCPSGPLHTWGRVRLAEGSG